MLLPATGLVWKGDYNFNPNGSVLLRNCELALLLNYSGASCYPSTSKTYGLFHHMVLMQSRNHREFTSKRETGQPVLKRNSPRNQIIRILGHFDLHDPELNRINCLELKE